MKKASYLITYSLFFLLAFIFFPSWLAAVTEAGRIILFSILLLVWLSGLLIISFFWKSGKKEITSTKISKQHKLVFILAFVVLLFMLYPALTQSIRSKTDEGVHVHMGAALLEYSIFTVQSVPSLYLITSFLLWLIVVVVLSLYLFRKKWLLEVWRKSTKYLSEHYLISSISIGLFCFLWLKLILYLTSSFAYSNINALVVPYESLGIVFTSLSLLLTGYSEIFVRLPHSLFLLLGALFIYKLVTLYSDRRTALWSSLVYLFIPIDAFFFSSAKPIAAETFFVIASLYYFLRYRKFNHTPDLWVSMLITGTGTMFKFSSMSAFVVISLYVFINWVVDLIKTRDLKLTIEYLKTYLPPFSVALIFIVPRFVIFSTYHNVLFWPVNSPYSWYHLTSYAKLLPLQITWLATLILFTSLILILFRKRNTLHYFVLTWLFGLYLLFSSHRLIVAPRWTVVLMPAVAILIGEFFSWFTDLKFCKKVYLGQILFLLFCANLLYFTNAFVYIDDYHNQFLPHEEASNWIVENTDPGLGIYRMFIPYYFYERMAGVKNPVEIGVYAPLENQSIETLYQYAKRNNIAYLMFPVGNVVYNPTANVPIGPYSASYYYDHYLHKPTHPWTDNVFNYTLISQLQSDNEYFEPVARFDYYNNSIIISKIKDSVNYSS